MVKSVLQLIHEKGYISRAYLSNELRVDERIIDDAIAHLIGLGYLLEEESGPDCLESCARCPFAQNCGKQIVKSYRISDKGNKYLQKDG